MTMLETKGRELGLLKLRDFATPGTLTRLITIETALKKLSVLRASDVVGRAEVEVAMETIKGTFFLSPDGSKVYGLKPTTRIIDGRKVKMLSIKSVTPVNDVLSFTEAK